MKILAKYKFVTAVTVLLASTLAYASIVGLPFTKEVDERFDRIEDALVVSSTGGIATLANGETIDNTTTDDTVNILSDDEAITLQLTGFEAKSANLNLYADQGDDSADKFSLNVSTADVFSIGNNASAIWSMSSAGAVTMTGTLAGNLAPQVAATATTITAAQCGSTFSNTGAVAINLPEASTAIGCTLTFVTLNASNFDINPDDADTIMVLTNANGDSIRNATLGNTVILRAVSASQWAQLAAVGTWSDIN
jgi:hypothetical protein